MSNESKKVPYFTPALLRECYKHNERWGLNRQISEEEIKNLPADGRFPVVGAMHHKGDDPSGSIEFNTSHIRVWVYLDDSNPRCDIDVPRYFYDYLPSDCFALPVTA